MSRAKRALPWVPVWAIIVASILVSFEYGKVPPAAPDMIEVLGISYTTQGLLMTAFSVAAVVMGLIGGTMIDKLGARKVVSVALALTIVGNVAGLFWTSDAGLLVTRVLEGLGYGATMTAGPGVIAAWYEPKRRGLANGVWGANVGVGMVICTASATPILEAGGWSGMWIFGLVGAVLAFLLVAIFVCMPPDNERKDSMDLPPATDADKSHGVLWGYLAPLPVLAALMFFLVGGATDAFNAFTITYLNLELGEAEGISNLTATVASFGMMTGAIIMGFLFAKIRDKGMVLLINIALCAVALFAWFNLALSPEMMCAVSFFIGCLLGAAPTAFFAVAPMAARSPGTIGAATGMVVLGQNAGTLLIPTVVGMILDASGYGMAAMFMGGISVAAALACVAFRVLYKKHVSTGDGTVQFASGEQRG